MGRMIVVANRLPVSISKQEGDFHLERSPGGLASSLAALPESLTRVWLGWPGIPSDGLELQEREDIRRRLAGDDCIPVFLSQSLLDHYYLGFCNETIWPLFHYFPTRTVFEPGFWEAYQQVNRLFCEELMNVVQPGDRLFSPH
ncbi:MAG: bifunctional alpha,alpha-trehalose-phosphate synthase (UDP-forming)/trehalose-phosphatase, partial [Planctomycetes bacterium]|nr:bifunctional alpha,alpha-trehalose-phosphate synthase (UDP-forming)/trehalose-phosphatase [Planctomycetota bacterium]